MTASKKTSPGKASALDLLRADHDKVRALFREFDDLHGIDEQEERKAELSDEICALLSLHATLEEEIFYPAVRSLIDNDTLMDEVEVEHAGARELIRRLEAMYPGDEHYEATMAVLEDETLLHLDKEENIIFPAAQLATLDMRQIGERLQERREQLEEDLSSPPSSVNGQGAADDDDTAAYRGHGPT